MVTESQAPDLEELAAYIDGRLSGERKKTVEERLLRDEAFYEIYLGTVDFQQQDVPAESKVVRGSWWRRAAPWIGTLAAAAVLAGVLLPRLVPGPRVEDWVELLDAGSIVVIERWTQAGMPTMRGGSEPSSQELENAFSVGVETIQLRVALATGDRAAADGLAGRLANKADEAGLIALALVYGAWGESNAEVQESLRMVTEIERELEPKWPETRRFLLGAWSESGRLAALARDGDALARIYRKAPRVDEEAAGKIAAELEKLESMLERSPLTSTDFEEAEATFRSINRKLSG